MIKIEDVERTVKLWPCNKVRVTIYKNGLVLHIAEFYKDPPNKSYAPAFLKTGHFSATWRKNLQESFEKGDEFRVEDIDGLPSTKQRISQQLDGRTLYLMYQQQLEALQNCSSDPWESIEDDQAVWETLASKLDFRE